MATKNIVPNDDSEGQLGTSSKFWSLAHLDGLNIGNDAAANLVFTPSANDTITLAAAANGAFTITTVDTAAAAANVGFVVDGNFTVSNVTSTITSSSSDITTFATTNATSGYTEFAYNTSTVAGYIGNGTSLLSGAANTDFIMRSESGALKFTTGGGNLALTLDSSQNATFSGIVNASRFVSTGANLSHTASSIKISQEDNATSEIRCYGADATTQGTFQLRLSASDGAPDTTALGFDASANATFAGNITTTDTGATVTIQDDADSTSGGTLALQNTDTGANNHESGRIYFYGDNNGNTVKESVLIRGIMTDASAGAEDTKLEIMTLANGGQVSSLNIAGNDSTFSGTLTANGTLKTGTATTVSPESVADDFIIDPGVASVGMSIMGSGQCAIKFGDAADADVGGITYVHGSDNEMIFTAGATNTASIVATGVNITGQMYSTSVKVNDLGSGDVFSTGAGILTNSDPSDSRLKTNIENIDYGLSEILKLRSIKFNWLNGDKNSKKQFGFIAQEVKEIIPESVSEFDYDGDQRFGLEKNAIYVGLVKAIQEQQVIIEDLKSRIETLEG